MLVHRVSPRVRPEGNQVKEDRGREGRAHAALVFDDSGSAQGWSQYGSPEELPGISATAELFERYGFRRGRQVGKHAWIVSREVDPA
jgi:hypothetical protein